MTLKGLFNIVERCVNQVKGPHGFWYPGPFRILWSRWYSQLLSNHNGKFENLMLVPNLELMGVDVAKAKKRYPPMFRNSVTHEKSLKEFLLQKGADQQTVASVISRFPKAIIYSPKYLAELWTGWENILKTESAVLKIVNRSPESFFRSGGIEKLTENISFFLSLGLPPKVLSQLMSKAPRTFSNSVQLNKQKVDFLRELCTHLEGKDLDECIREMITSNIFILTKSTKRVKVNLESIRTILKVEDKDLLSWLKKEGASILGLCNTYVKDNFMYIQQRFQALGCLEVDVSRYIYENPTLLLLSPKMFDCKLSFLLDVGAEASQILQTPVLMDVSLGTMKNKVKMLQKLDYDFKNNGVSILLHSQSRFRSKLEKLSSLPDKEAKL